MARGDGAGAVRRAPERGRAETLAEVLGHFRGPAARALLGRLAGDESAAVRAAAAESLTDPR